MKQIPREKAQLNQYNRWRYFKDYYLVKVMISLVIFTIVISFVVERVNKVETALYIAILNEAKWVETELLEMQIAEELQLNPKQEIKMVAYNLDEMSDVNKLHTLFANGQVDLIISDFEIVEFYFQQGYLSNLNTILDEKFLNINQKPHYGINLNDEWYGIELMNSQVYQQLNGVIENPVIAMLSNTGRTESVQQVLSYFLSVEIAD